MEQLAIELTNQQVDLFNRQADAAGMNVRDLLEVYLEKATPEDMDPRTLAIGPGTRRRPDPSTEDTDLGSKRLDLVLEPVSGKAIPLQAGEVLRIRQTKGGQTVDFNAFNLHDYKECMSVGHSRRQGIHLKQGDVLLSISPRLRPMFYFGYVPPTCTIDTLAARCAAPLFELRMGYEWHTNCQDTFAEAIREYGLTPDDVHDSCNMFQNTRWDEDGAFWSEWNTGTESDYVDLVACMDTLAVPIVCGSGDVTLTSNFSIKPLQVEVWTGNEQTTQMVERAKSRFVAPRASKGPESYREARIKPDRELRADPDYVPQFWSAPVATQRIAVEINDLVGDRLTKFSASFGCSRAETARRVVMAKAISEL